jgi:hypothetical protein
MSLIQSSVLVLPPESEEGLKDNRQNTQYLFWVFQPPGTKYKSCLHEGKILQMRIYNQFWLIPVAARSKA